jgi:hypothetical protein
MKIILNIIEIIYQMSATLLVSIVDSEKENTYLSNNSDKVPFSIINQDLH